jgi:hypothetical protein
MGWNGLLFGLLDVVCLLAFFHFCVSSFNFYCYEIFVCRFFFMIFLYVYLKVAFFGFFLHMWDCS